MRALPLAILLVVPVLAGCLGAPTAPTAPAGLPGDDGGISAAPLAGYLHDLSAPDPDLPVEDGVVEHLRVAAPDGTPLDTWVVRPDVEEPVPVVLTVTPYYGGGPPSSWGRLGDVLVPRGYAVALSSVRGTGNSGGCFTQAGPGEARDTAQVVQALGQADWSNGQVGMIGVSYPGTTPQDVWALAPEHLETIVPIAGISDMYKYNFVHGVPINVQGFGFNTYYWPLTGLTPVGLSGGNQLNDPRSVPAAVAGEACAEQVDVQQGGATSTVDGNKDAYWQARDFLAEVRDAPAKDRPSVFYIHGLQDWNVKPHNMEGWLPALQASGVPFKAWLGQWGHAWPHNPGTECADGQACRTDWWNETMVAWFDRFLKDRETGILDAPAVQVQSDDMTWRHEADWPPTDAGQVVLHPTGDGVLSAEAGDGQATYFDYGGHLRPAARGPPDRVVWVSEPLDRDLHISGLPRFVADVTASGHRASLMLTLAERSDGGDRAFNFAAQSLNHVDSLSSGQTSIAGQTQRVNVTFFPQDDVVQKGSRLVLIAAGNLVADGEPSPSLQPVGDGSDIAVDLADAKLVLPVDGTVTAEDPQPYGSEG